MDLRFVWQAWRLATSTFTLCGRRGTYGNQLGLVTRLVAAGAASFCVAGVALGDMDLRFDLRVIPEAEAVHLQPLKRAFLVGSVRNPCESYLSLWAFQSDPRRRAGLMSDLKRRRPEDYARLVGKDASSDYTSPKDIQRFRTWIRFLAHDQISLGLMSGRFYGKYISTSEVNMRDNAMLVKDLSSSHATEILESLKSMEVKDLADCWLHTETMDEDLNRCLKQYAARGGRVDLQLLSASGVKGASNHGNCEIFFDKETAQLVGQLDAHLFSKFGYTTCCGHDISREEPSGRSGFGTPWSWADPFDRAAGRPLATHSGSTMWKARVGPCDSSVAGPDELALKTVQMLTLPSIRMALDESILACLKSADLSTDRKGAQLMMYQGVLSGLVLSCAFLASRLDFSPLEPFSQTDIDAIFEHWGMHREGVQQDKKKKLSIFSLTGFKNRVWTHTKGRNLAQLAVWMGHADLIRAILGGEPLSKPVDEKRTLRDYLIAPGSPVYNWPMADLMASAVLATAGRYRVERPKPTGVLSCDGTEYPELSLGWTQDTTWDHYGACDFEVLDALSQKDFEENFRDLGRPVLVRNFAFIEDRCNVRKGYVMQVGDRREPAGTGRDFLKFRNDEILNEAVVIWDSAWTKPISGVKYILHNVDTMPLNPYCDFCVDEKCVPLPLLHDESPTVRVIEMFAGAVGGWKIACDFLGMHDSLSFRTLALELDLDTARAYSVAHLVPLVNGMSRIDPRLAGLHRNLIAHADVTSDCWLALGSAWAPDLAVISPPCQPWSSAGSGSGLLTDEGQLIVKAIAQCKVLRPKIIALEEVSAFGLHEHFHFVMQALRWAGYILHHAQTIDASDILPIARSRWLAIALRVNAESNSPCPFQMWKPCKPCTPNAWDAELDDCLLRDTRLFPDQHVMSMSSRHDLLPPAKRRLVKSSNVLQSRCYDGTEKLPTLVASYGSQHRFALSSLMEKGLMNHFTKDQHNRLRYWHPIEMWLFHAAHGRFLFHNNWEIAFRHLGNQICPPHAILVLANALNCLGKIESKLDVAACVSDFVKCRIVSASLRYRICQSGILASDDVHGLSDEHLSNIDHFHQGLVSGFIPDGLAWTTDGFQPFALDDLNPDVLPTAPFPTYEKITLHFGNEVFEALVQHGLDRTLIAQAWDDAFTFHADSLDVMIPCQGWQPTCDPSPKLLFVLHQGTLHITRDSAEAKTWFEDLGQGTFQAAAAIPGFPCEFAGSLATCGFRIRPQNEMQHSAAKLLHAMFSCRTTCETLQHSFSLKVMIVGAAASQQIVCAFWQDLLTKTEMQGLGLCLKVEANGTGICMTWHPSSNRNPLPVPLLQVLLFKCALQKVFHALRDENGSQILLKVFGDTWWTGPLPKSLTIETIKNFIHVVSWIRVDKLHFRIVNKGHQPPHDQMLSAIESSPHRHAIVLHAVLQMHGGGTENGTKQGHRTQIKNAIAGTLLEEGHELVWVTKAVDDVIAKLPTKDLSKILQLQGNPHRYQQTISWIKMCGVEIPKINPSKASQAANLAKKKKVQQMPNPDNYRVVEGVLVNEDGSSTAHLPVFGGQLSGYHFCTAQTALPWLRTGEILSKDELCLLMFGELPFATKLAHQAITVPCVDELGRSVLAACTLIQCGDRKVSVKAGDGHKINADGTVLVAVTWWKHDWKDLWSEICSNPYRFFRRSPGVDALLVSVWGKSFRNGRQATSPQDATSIQVHCLLKEDGFPAFLKLSGYNLMWLTPKTTDGRPHDAWKLLWLPPQTDIQAATAIATKLADTSGLACQRNRFAIRVPKGAYADAWKQLFPTEPVPADIPTTRIYKVESLPLGVTSKMIQEWADHNSWKCKPLRPLGPKAWMLGSGDEPPAGPSHFNGSPLLIRELKNKHQHATNPIIAGPRPSNNRGRVSSQEVQAATLQTDPWAAWTGPKPAVQASLPASLGPNEQQFAKQADRLNKLEDVVKKIQEEQASQGHTIAQIHEDTAKRDHEIRQHLDNRLQMIKTELDQSFASALHTQSKQFAANMDEIKGVAIRYGEAIHPGPEPVHSLPINFCITNPTCVSRKADIYRDLFVKRNCHVITMSETAATEVVQKKVSAQLKAVQAKVLWSPPVPPLSDTTQGLAHHRGKASGVAIAAVVPLRPSRLVPPGDWSLSTRFLYTIVQVGQSHVQVVTLYCRPSSLAGAAEYNDELMNHAIRQIGLLPLPFVILGDLNQHVQSFEAWNFLEAQGCRSLDSLHTRLFGVEMPMSCKSATRPDNAILSSRLAPWVSDIRVFDSELATHKPVFFTLNLPGPVLFSYHLRFPKSMVELDIDDKTWMNLPDATGKMQTAMSIE
eukprot:s1543_g39.t3